MPNWFETMRISEGDVGQDEGEEDRGIQGIHSSNSPVEFPRPVLDLHDDELNQATDTINALHARRKRLVEEMLKLAEEISKVDAAICLVAQVHLE